MSQATVQKDAAKKAFQQASEKMLDFVKEYLINTEPTMEKVISDLQSQVPQNQQLQNLILKLQESKKEMIQNPQDIKNIISNMDKNIDQWSQNINVSNLDIKKMQIKQAKNLITTISNKIKGFVPNQTNQVQNNTAQIDSNNVQRKIFTVNSTYDNPNIDIQPIANKFRQNIVKYDNKVSQINLQDLIYTSIIDKNFMRSEPNSVVFWSKCDVPDSTVIANNQFWNESLSQDIWGNNRNSHIPSTTKLLGDQTSDTIAHSLNRHTLRDVWKYNIDNGKTLVGNINKPVFNEMSKLLAERASGEVIFISGDKNPTTDKYGDTWENIEKPTLMKNPDVTMIVEIDVKEPNKVKTITFPHGITQEIKSKYPIFANLKKQIQKIDYTSNPIQYISYGGRSLSNPLTEINTIQPIKRIKSPIKPLQLRNSQRTNNQKITRTNSFNL